MRFFFIVLSNYARRQAVGLQFTAICTVSTSGSFGNLKGFFVFRRGVGVLTGSAHCTHFFLAYSCGEIMSPQGCQRSATHHAECTKHDDTSHQRLLQHAVRWILLDVMFGIRCIKGEIVKIIARVERIDYSSGNYLMLV